MEYMYCNTVYRFKVEETNAIVEQKIFPFTTLFMWIHISSEFGIFSPGARAKTQILCKRKQVMTFTMIEQLCHIVCALLNRSLPKYLINEYSKFCIEPVNRYLVVYCA